jgi:hypothetical protein
MSISKESKKALLIYFSLEKFKSISPLTETSFIVKRFSAAKLFEKNKNVTTAKKMQIYLLEMFPKYFKNK